MRKGLSWIVAVILVVMGCSHPKYYIREGESISLIRKVAVLPFQNNTREKFAGERIRDLVITEILSQGIFDVIEKGEVDAALRYEAVEDPSSIDKVTLMRLGKRLKVGAFIMGSVDQYEEVRRGSYTYPVVSITLRIVDAKTGEVLWQASGRGTGYSTIGRLLGLNSKDITQISMEVVGKLLETLR